MIQVLMSLEFYQRDLRFKVPIICLDQFPVHFISWEQTTKELLSQYHYVILGLSRTKNKSVNYTQQYYLIKY